MYGWNSTSTPRRCRSDTYGSRCSRLSATKLTLQPSSSISSSIACMRTEPESWSGVSMQASTTSTRRRTPRSRSSSGRSPLARCAPSSAAHFCANVPWLTTWCRLIPAASVGARGLSFEVDDGRARLVDHLAPRGAHREGEIGVLVVRGGVARIEAAQRREQRGRDGEAGAGAVIGLAQVVVLGPGRDRRRGRRSTRCRRARRCRRPPAAGRRGRRAWRRRAPRRAAGGRPRAARRASRAVTMVSLLRKTSTSPRASPRRGCRCAGSPGSPDCARCARR